MPVAPDLSVVVPTYNRAPVLRRCLAALAAQTVARLEVLVVDDGSTDDTPAVAAEAARAGGPRVRYFHQANAGANAARNRALAEAAAPIVLLINDDTIAVPELAAVHLARHARHPDEGVAVLGRMTIAPEFERSPLSALHHDAAFAAFAGRDELPWTAFFTCNVSARRAFLLRHGGFDERLRWHEDIELGERLRHHGLRLLYAPDALGYHLHELTERDYLRIAEREGTALVTWFRARPDLLPELTALGLHGPPPLARAARHRVADAAFPVGLVPLALAGARALAPVAPGAARLLYEKAFQRVKRATIARALRAGPPRAPDALGHPARA